MISSQLELHRYALGRQTRVVTAMTLLKSHLFKCVSLPIAGFYCRTMCSKHTFCNSRQRMCILISILLAKGIAAQGQVTTLALALSCTTSAVDHAPGLIEQEFPAGAERKHAQMIAVLQQAADV